MPDKAAVMFMSRTGGVQIMYKLDKAGQQNKTDETIPDKHWTIHI
jgi:hypothetical protein